MADLSSILSAIAADSLLTSWNPVVETLPDYELKDTKTAKCCVVPGGIDFRNLSRGSIHHIFTVEIGFIKRSKSLNVLSLVTEIKGIADGLMPKTFSDARVVGVAYEPLYDEEQLRERNLFQGVLSVKLEEVK